MQERLTAMLHHTNVFIVLPGGFGTLEEIFTMASWVQLHIHEKPIGSNQITYFIQKMGRPSDLEEVSN
ncbi:hypothetical protein Ddye_026644 [Dipteronia dyeriana]|uniref:cytokinin riboside 5'-monophosphate phosphoribohydrolase n=1 Tax=Dipteronia dyeriana TaxID=168575 RepID=A0AAD9WPE3_9ROSI|nr:hypothetical protein Ddye_026644 [Dipteronia dyeriana]